MKAILKYKLPEENAEFTMATKGSDLAFIIFDLDQWLRQNYKYESGEISVEAAEKVREKLRDLMFEKDLSFDSLIFA